jgi:hypothetical protein
MMLHRALRTVCLAMQRLHESVSSAYSQSSGLQLSNAFAATLLPQSSDISQELFRGLGMSPLWIMDLSWIYHGSIMDLSCIAGDYDPVPYCKTKSLLFPYHE